MKSPNSSPDVPLCRPEYFRLPRSGQRDPYFNCTRSWYLQKEREKALHLSRILQSGKNRGIVLIPYAAMLTLIAAEDSSNQK